MGFPATASASDLTIGSSVTLVQQGTIYNPGNGGVFFPNTILGTINTADTAAANALTIYGVPATTQPFVLTTAMKNNMPGGSFTWDNFKFNVGSTYQIYSLSNPTSNYSLVGGLNYSSAKLDYANSWSEAKLNIGGTERWVVFSWYNLILIEGSVDSAGLSSSFSSPSSYDYSFTVQINNFDPAFTYSVTSTAGQASINSTGLVTVRGLGVDQSATITVTTTRTGYQTVTASIAGRSQVAPMIPTNKPKVTISGTSIMCTMGSYSATPTSSIFSLSVGGIHVATSFSATGEYLPDWIAPWATATTITRTATLTSATWAMNDSYRGKAITCSTVAYSKNATGSTLSEIERTI